MTKLTKPELERLNTLLRCPDATCMASEWTTGNGRHTKFRVLPPFSKRIDRRDYADQPKRIQRVFNKHPRAQAVVAVTDIRAANKATK